MARIAFLLPNLTPGGAERVGLTLSKSFVERGHEVDLLVAEKRGTLIDQVPPGVRLINLNAKRIRDVPFHLSRYLRERRPDAFQVSLWPLTVAGIIGAWRSRVPVRVIVSDHISLFAPIRQREAQARIAQAYDSFLLSVGRCAHLRLARISA